MTSKSPTAVGGRDTRYNHSVLLVFSAVLLQPVLYDSVSGHGRLVEPPSRASMWRYGYATKPDFHDNQLWCGGFTVCAIRQSDLQFLSRSELAKLIQPNLI